MESSRAVIVRRFDGSLAQADGVLAVERATFDESPYSPAEVQAMLSDGLQQGWVAVAQQGVVGFCLAFATHGLAGTVWEIDLLAVLPQWRGRGIASRLIRAAAAHGATLAPRARAVVATDNQASAHAFVRAGFRVAPDLCELLIYRTSESTRRSSPRTSLVVRPAADMTNWRAWAEDLPSDMAPPDQIQPPHDGPFPGLTLLMAEDGDQPAGYAELLSVQTLLYRGVWIESLGAATQGAREALIHAALDYGLMGGLDEIGSIVPQENWPLCHSLLAAGFRSLGTFSWLRARLPLPGLARGGSWTEHNG